jgi:hypothetical protein
VSRLVNYVRERRRAMPRSRGAWRRIYSAPRTGGLRVHHFLPGIGLAFVSGGIAVVNRTDQAELLFGVPFGVGTALTLDELALLVGMDNSYWRSERLALAQAAATGLGAAALAARVGRLGRSSSASA